MSKLSKALIAAAGNSGGAGLTVEDVFSTYLYTGNGTSQTITNDIDLSGEGGMVWIKDRTSALQALIHDTVRGANYNLRPDSTAAQDNNTTMLTGFNSDGFDIGSQSKVNYSGDNYASWTFRKAEKFFDVVTYTGDGAYNRSISHNLGSDVGFLVVKRIDASSLWHCYHQAIGAQQGRLNETIEFRASEYNNVFHSSGTEPTDSVFYVGGSNPNDINASGATYVAYLFASDAGGFGDDGSESIIKCGSASATAGTWTDVNVGFEPQWVLIKNSTATGSYNTSGNAGSNDWYVIDSMRGATAATGSNTGTVALSANSSIAEYNDPWFGLTSTGFSFKGLFSGSDNFIYIAIRRPMKTPESGTEVFAASTRTGTTAPSFPASFNVVDAAFRIYRPGGGDYARKFGSRLTGVRTLYTSSTAAEVPDSEMNWDYMNGWNSDTGVSTDIFSWMFKRATGFFDVVAYTGDGTSSRSLNHNLGVTPELMIIKQRSAARSWAVYSSAIGTGKFLKLEDTAGVVTQSGIFDTAPTSSVFTVDSNTYVNISGGTYISYLFATLAGVSKVGSYTGTGSTPLNVDCGFSSGARFVMIKRADGTGGWYVHDTTRGIVAGNDPMLPLNSTAAEATTNDYIDPYPSGFTVSNTFTGYNASGSTYIFLAIA